MTEWIKCSEVEPPKGRELLVYTGEDFGVGAVFGPGKNGKYFFDGFGPIWGVTHWAELPEKPEHL